jgi:hypothetical protein
VFRATVIDDGKIIDELPLHSGGVTADRTQAIMRSFEIEVADPDGTRTPTDMTSELAPFGNRIQLERGVRISDVEFQTVQYNAANPWTVSNTSTGVFNSMKVDGSGNLTLGP